MKDHILHATAVMPCYYNCSVEKNVVLIKINFTNCKLLHMYINATFIFQILNACANFVCYTEQKHNLFLDTYFNRVVHSVAHF